MNTKINIFIFIICIYSGFLNAQEPAQGSVFLDENRNGTMDSEEKRLSNVCISNGEEVVLTDNKGRYSITIDEKDATIFVIKPSNYQLPKNELNQPQFFYIHKPNGSPDLKYKGVKPTGPLPKSLDFPLIEGEAKDSFSVLIFGDSQVNTLREVGYFDLDIVAELHGVMEYEFGITLGDMIADRLGLFPAYNESIARIGLPWFHVIGNHDINKDAEKNKHHDETFEANYGPPTYSFNHGKAHFIILDNVIFPRDDGKSGYVGSFTDKQYNFIKNDLKHVPKDHLIVLVFHIPFFRMESMKPVTQLFELLKDYPHTFSLAAHSHLQRVDVFDIKDGWKQINNHIQYNVGTTCGDWWSGKLDERGIPPTLMRDGTPNGYGILNINGNTFTFDYKVAGKPKDYRMSIWGPKVVPDGFWHPTRLYVNYFLGNEYTNVEFRVKGEGHEWQRMARVEEYDPYVVALNHEWDTDEELPEEGRRPSVPVVSTHLWRTTVPNNWRTGILSQGEHTIEIRVTDIFGRSFKDEYTYQIVEPKYTDGHP